MMEHDADDDDDDDEHESDLVPHWQLYGTNADAYGPPPQTIFIFVGPQ